MKTKTQKREYQKRAKKDCQKVKCEIKKDVKKIKSIAKKIIVKKTT